MPNLIKNILVPTDNSVNSREALRHALALAERYKSTIYVVHVIDFGYLEEALKCESIPSRTPLLLEKKIFKKGLKETEKFIKKSTECNKGYQTVTIIKKGTPFREIITTAREKEIDLIVMGTHGRTALSHALMGSVAEKVVRNAPCPVMTVKPKNYKFKAA